MSIIRLLMKLEIKLMSLEILPSSKQSQFKFLFGTLWLIYQLSFTINVIKLF